ncbi:insulinase family protein [Modestobacter versicolor]|uniref:Insulinase family protein n=1 Tax=Modestobacter versicolor TaxID=429133 RepID=A0A839Y4S3_9ACTN|nr:insulinase family protein [Modestobacter versicolor]MBB3678198.1 hypothetical protein [Modestobacter versicolor]
MAADNDGMERTDVDGVPVFAAPGPERITAGLVFGVGFRDETFATREVSHLIEHLAMGALPKSHLKCNATTDVDSTTFFATGRPEAVRDFLEGVCRALSDLPLERMAMEVGVLQAESCSTGYSTAASMWAARYALTGPGLAVTDGPGPDCLTPEVVRAHAARWFVRENAALWCHGELPAGLRLPLPGGAVPVRVRPVPRPQQGPVWTKGEAPGVGLLLADERPYDIALRMGVEVLSERLRDVARHARGLSYHVAGTGLDVTPERRELAVWVDAREGQEAPVAGIVWQQFSTLCQDGPTAEELAHALAGFEEDVDSEPDAVVASDLADAALCAVTGMRPFPVAEALAAWRAVTPADVVASLRTAWASALLYVPEWAHYAGPAGPVERRYTCNVVPGLPAGTVFQPPAVSRALKRQVRLTVVVNDAVLAHSDADGDVHCIPWDAVEAVAPIDESRGVVVVGRNLCSIVVHPEVYGKKTAERIVEAIRGHVPAERWLQRRPAPTLAPVG